MLKYSKENINRKIKVKIDQIAYPPRIYLDTWVLFDFIEDNKLFDKFIKILNSLGGTLMFSTVSIIESMAIDDQDQIQNLYKFIDLIGTDKIAFLDFNFMRVIKKEKMFKKISPAIDFELLNSFVRIHNPKNPLKVSEIFSSYRQGLENSKVLNEKWQEDLFPIILRARNNVNALSNAKTRFRKRKKNAKTCNSPCTEFLMETYIDYITINENMKMPNKEWRDIFHTIVPVAYCDFVLIDKRWKSFIQSTGLNYPQIAEVYEKRNLSDFLKDLENYESPL